MIKMIKKKWTPQLKRNDEIIYIVIRFGHV